MFEIKNEKELDILLKLIAEESVKKAKKTLKEIQSVDPKVKDLKIKKERSKSILGEQEDEEENTESSPEDESLNSDEKEASPNPAADKAMQAQYTDDFKGSYESIRDAINTLRAGRSLKDKDISTELRGYYDRLDENERAVLLLFLNELAKILTGALDGSEAQDPSDPKTYFDITKREKEESQSDTEQEKSQSGKAEKKVSSSTPTSDEEDTSPPIKVNESQDFSRIREKINKLING